MKDLSVDKIIILFITFVCKRERERERDIQGQRAN